MLKKIKLLQERDKYCKHDFQIFVKSSKSLNINFSTLRNAFDKSGLRYDLVGIEEKKNHFIKYFNYGKSGHQCKMQTHKTNTQK